METPLVTARPQRRAPLAALGKLTVAALVGIGLLIPFAMVVIGGGKPDAKGISFSIFAWLLAAVVAGWPVGGWRWSPLLGTLLGSLLLASAVPIIPYGLSNTASTLDFAFWVVFLPTMLIACLAGIGATVQNYRYAPEQRRTPRWLPASLALLGGWALGAIVVGLLIAATPQATSGASVSTATLAALPALTTSNFAFSQPELRAKVGETVALRLDNRDPVPHSFDINELNVHVPILSGKPGLALFKPTQPGSYTFYCSLPGHREKGMVGKFVVAP